MKKLFQKPLKRTSEAFEDDPVVLTRPYPLTESRSSSFTYLPLGASAPFSPRPTSPHSATSIVPSQPKSIRDRDKEPHLLRKRPPIAAPPAAVSILRALDPHLETQERASDFSDETSSHGEPLMKDDKKRPFWDRGKEKERERDHDRDLNRDRERRDEETPAELTKLIGYLTASGSEDWALVLEACERASATESKAKEAVKALRREFKYAEPSAQLSAARLWAIMLRNSSRMFVRQSSSRKFLDTIEEVLSSQKTAPVVRERLLDVVAAAAYDSVSKSDKDGFRGLWRRVKPADKPDEGVPFDPADAMFNPVVHQRSPSIPDNYKYHSRSTNPSPPSDEIVPFIMNHKSNSRNRVISVEEDIKRLFSECKVGRGNATLLSDALMFTKPEDINQREIMKEFYSRCRASQELIYAQIPWATAGAERSRLNRANNIDRNLTNVLQALLPPSGGDVGVKDASPVTTEERLLAALLGANEELLEAIRMYDDMQRIIEETNVQSKGIHIKHRNRSSVTSTDGLQILTFASPEVAYSSESPSPSPSLPPSPVSISLTTTNQTTVLASPAQSPHPTPVTPSHQPSLAPPPPAPHGPRLPSPNYPRSGSPSPERPISIIEETYSPRMHRKITESYDTNEDDDEYNMSKTPIGLSEKALGKRRVIEDDEADRLSDTGDSFFGNVQDTTYSSDSLDGDPDDHRLLWHQPVHYVYDAAAERTQERIKYELSSLVKEVH